MKVILTIQAVSLCCSALSNNFIKKGAITQDVTARNETKPADAGKGLKKN